MKAFWDGIKKAKIRTALNAVVIFIAVTAACVLIFSIFNFNSFSKNIGKIQSEIPQNSFQGDISSDDASDVSFEREIENIMPDSNNDEDSTEQFNNERIGTTGRNTNIPFIIGVVAIFVIAIVLLFVINFVSTKKKKAMFSEMINHGISYKAIRSELFKEAFVIVLIFGIVGTAVGTLISKPVVSAIMPSSNISAGQFQGPDQEDRNFDFNGGIGENGNERPDGNAENDFSADMPDLPDMNGDNSQNLPQFGDNSGDFNNGGNSISTTQQYLITIACGIVFTLVASCIAGISCFLPIKKEN